MLLGQVLIMALAVAKLKHRSLAANLTIPLLLVLGFLYAVSMFGPHLQGPWRGLLWVIPITLPVLGWLWAEAIFTEGFRLRPGHLGALVMLPLMNVGQWSLRVQGRPHRLLIWAVLAGIGLCCVRVLVLTIRHWRADLVEARRQLRALIVGIFCAETAIGVGLDAHAHRFGLTSTYHALSLGNFGLLLALQTWLGLRALPFHAPWLNPAVERRDPPAQEPGLIDALQALMQDGAYRQEGLTLADLAEKLEVPAYRLRRAINQHLGYRNFNCFLNTYRTQAAAAMLADPAHKPTKILAIALEVGFRSLAPFNKAFKEAYGIPPSAYRRRQHQRTP